MCARTTHPSYKHEGGWSMKRCKAVLVDLNTDETHRVVEAGYGCPAYARVGVDSWPVAAQLTLLRCVETMTCHTLPLRKQDDSYRGLSQAARLRKKSREGVERFS